ncbi:MAG TPA: signal recognition particle-docking protein FtsY [Polyangiaceae bacterium]|jgi:fused signal recognition particle receptor|nr:signal recognition particle-docking protein FtsY [Polyangiaceae bacterium]
MIYVLIALVVAAVAYFLFFRKGEPAQLPSRPAENEPPARQKSSRPAAKTAPEEEDVEAPPASGVAPSKPSARTPAAEASPPPPPVRPSHAPPSARAGAAAQVTARAPRDIEGLRRGLSKARASEGFFGRLRALFAGKKELNPEVASELEEVLLSSDVGTETTALLLARVKEVLSGGDLADPDKVWDALRAEAERIVSIEGTTGPLELKHKPTVVLLVGVNGAGKTTTIGKLATKLHSAGKKCVLAAGDTFRAAAVQQLVVWGGRVGCEVVRGKDGADPGSVVFDAIKKAQETGVDVVLADTAGRLHTKSNLMAEMKKIAKTAEKALAGAPHEILLVIDATNGQNALAQAKEFKEALPLTGIVLTKLDGTAKGGVVLGIANALRLPVRFVGLGERPDDLHEFAPADFVEALLGREAAE